MFSPSELEGEVDHSFFDSDCDSISKDGEKKFAKREVKAEKEISNTGASSSPRTGETTNHPEQVKRNTTNGAEEKEGSCGSEVEETSRTSSGPSIACTANKVISNGASVEKTSKTLHETFLVLQAEGREVDDEDGYHQSQSESEEEEGLSSAHKYSGSKGRKASTPKKLIRKRHQQSLSPPSAEADTDDTDSSGGCSEESCSLEYPSWTRPKTAALPSLSPGTRKTGVGSAGSPSLTEESDDTVTDVTPLSTPDTSPLQSLDRTWRSGAAETDDGEQRQLESVSSSCLSNTSQEDQRSVQDVDEFSLGSESHVGGELLFSHPGGGRNRKNYSFSNDEVRRIDRENQRLLRELSHPSPRSRPGSVAAAGRKTHTADNPPLVRLYHSGLNRQREQQRIERENLAFLKRLESVKPTPGLRRSGQLADYQRHGRYLGTPSCPIYSSTSKQERSSSKTLSGVSPTLATAARRSTVTTPVPSSNKGGVPRPAWC